jgi:ATP synthase protein I
MQTTRAHFAAPAFFADGTSTCGRFGILDTPMPQPYGPRAFETAAKAKQSAVFHGENGMSDNAPDPENLRALGERLDDAQRRRDAARKPSAPPTPMGIAGRFAAEMVAALIVGGGIGWGLDWLFGRFGVHTRPVFFLVMVVLGAAAGILNVVRAAREINAEIAAKQDKGN